MNNRLVFCAVAPVSLMPVAGWGQTKDSATPTFSKDVAPILYKNCASCHRAGEIAPMSLLTYEEDAALGEGDPGEGVVEPDATVACERSARHVCER